MNNNSIVAELKSWCDENESILSDSSIELFRRFPDQNSEFGWKASIDMTHDSVIVSYCVWERTIFQTSLIVLNCITKATIVMEDKEPERPENIRDDLRLVVASLIDGTYKKTLINPKIKNHL